MLISKELQAQTIEYLNLLEDPVTFVMSIDDSKESQKLHGFLKEICALSDKLTITEEKLEYTPSFSFKRTNSNEQINITFAGTPLGHEYSSFILALLQVSGRTPKITPEQLKIIRGIKEDLNFKSYVSLSCVNCSELVQALNIMCVINPNISHTMVDGAVFRYEVENFGIMAVPALYLNEKSLITGKNDLNSILEKLGKSTVGEFTKYTKKIYDILVIGGGPAGISSAIYSARKGLSVGLVAKELGGQVKETKIIENIIGTPHIEGGAFARDLYNHMKQYDIELIDTNAKKLNRNEPDNLIEITLLNNLILKARSVIIATGANWQHLNVPGENRLTSRGVSYCTHCDAPLYENKNVAVVGGGNSGVESALELANTAKHVTLIGRSKNLRADNILQEKLKNNSKITILTNTTPYEIIGGKKVEGLVYTNEDTHEQNKINIDGIFIQIGLSPNTSWLKNTLDCNEKGEIITDNLSRTSIEGVFAAGDCTNNSFKQIVISMGEGSTAALSAFNYLTTNKNMLKTTS